MDGFFKHICKLKLQLEFLSNCRRCNRYMEESRSGLVSTRSSSVVSVPDRQAEVPSSIPGPAGIFPFVLSKIMNNICLDFMI